MRASTPAAAMAVARPGGVALAWKTRSASPGASCGRAKREAEPGGERGARGVDVDQRHLRARQPRREPGDEQAEHAAADHDDAVGRAGAGVPMRVERGLHVGGEDGAARGHAVGHQRQPVGRARRRGPDAGAGRRRSCRASRPGRPRRGRRRNSRISPGRGNRRPGRARACARCSPAGTRPSKTSRSVPRLIAAPERADQAIAGPGAGSGAAFRAHSRRPDIPERRRLQGLRRDGCRRLAPAPYRAGLPSARCRIRLVPIA